ncbi:MAG: transposase [Clostridiales bacterium]|nr:transposase [Clostridiales bacterium]
MDYAAKKAELLVELARRDEKINIPSGSGLLLIQVNLAIIQSINQNLKILESEISRLVGSDAAIQENAALLDSIPGISAFGAAVILAEIGDFSAFNKPSELTAYFGLDPSVKQSGMFKGTKNKISKRGCRYARQLLNMVAVCNISKNSAKRANNPVLEAYYRRKTGSKPHKVVLCAVMNKMVHIIFAVLRDKKPFELRQPEAHAQWLREKNKRAA